MGASASGIKAAEQPAAESLLTAFKSLSASERRRHASVLNYWLSVRGEKEFPPLHDLDPLELSDAGPNSVLLELISGGHDAEIRHLGEALRDEAWPERIIDAPNPSVLACIAKKLPIVAISRDFLAFEDEYETASGVMRCSATLLPLSAGGAWVDYVYALVTVEQATASRRKKETHEQPEALEDDATAQQEDLVSQETEQDRAFAPEREDHAEAELPDYAACSEPEDAGTAEPESSADEEIQDIEDPDPVHVVDDFGDSAENPSQPHKTTTKAAPGFSKLLDSLAGLTGFYGSQPVKVDPVVGDATEVLQPLETERMHGDPGSDEPNFTTERDREEAIEDPAANDGTADDEPKLESPAPLMMEGYLQNKLTDVRAKADEARMARLRASAALHEGLAAAYDFALDAEDAPEEYLRLVEAQGLKIQLRSPMKPVVKLAFAGMCDEATIKQLEAVLAWAFEQELPRGSLADRIEAAGGIEAIVGEQAKAA